MRTGWILLLVAGAAACTPRAVRVARRMEGRYEIGDPGEGWTRVDPGGADHAWRQAATGAVIYTDSNCGTRYADVRLAALMDQLLHGIEEPSVLSEQMLDLDRREALYRQLRGNLDGVRVGVAAVTLKKGACSYDFVQIGPPAGLGTEAFFSVLDGFTTGTP